MVNGQKSAARTDSPDGGTGKTCLGGGMHCSSALVAIFYRAMLCDAICPCSGPVSVYPSVTSRSSTKTAKRRITKTTPHDKPRDSGFPLPEILPCQRSW